MHPVMCDRPNSPGPAWTPPPGDQSFSALEEAYRDGDGRDPMQNARVYNLAGHQRLPIAIVPAPDVRPPGVETRPVMHPAGPVGIFRRFALEGVGAFSQGTHGELRPGAAMPLGRSSQPLPNHGNTFRAAPQPWDAYVYVGHYPEGD